MGKQQDQNKAWALCVAAEAAAKKEDAECRKRGRHSAFCGNLVRESRKLKAEYERICKAPASNPLSVKHGEKFTREKIVGDLLGRNGPDTHHSIGGDRDRHPGA